MLKIRIEKEAAAFHEAGHVAMAYYHGRAINHVSIIGTWDSAGHVEQTHNVPSVQPPIDVLVESWTNYKKQWLDWSIMELMAGSVAELQHDYKSCIKDFNISAQGDMEQMLRWAELLQVDFPNDQQLEQLFTATHNVFNPDGKIWKFVCRLTTHLLKKETLTHKQCKKLWNSIVDIEDKME
jgi:hypothetical protein